MPAKREQSRAGREIKDGAAEKKKSGGRSSNNRSGQPLCIASHLHELRDENAECILFFRHLQKLGKDNIIILKEYCQKFGPVAKVLLSNVPADGKLIEHKGRQRPSGMGFVLMEDAEDAATLLAKGGEHEINGLKVSVRAFERRSSEGGSGGKDGTGAEVKDDKDDDEGSGDSHSGS